MNYANKFHRFLSGEATAEDSYTGDISDSLAILYLQAKMNRPLHGNGAAVPVTLLNMDAIDALETLHFSCKDDGFLKKGSGNYICFENLKDLCAELEKMESRSILPFYPSLSWAIKHLGNPANLQIYTQCKFCFGTFKRGEDEKHNELMVNTHVTVLMEKVAQLEERERQRSLYLTSSKKYHNRIPSDADEMLQKRRK